MDRTLKKIEQNGITISFDGNDKMVSVINSVPDDVTSLFLDFLSNISDNFDLEVNDISKIPEKNLRNYLEIFSKI